MRWPILTLALTGLMAMSGAFAAQAETNEIRIARTRSLGFLPLMVVEQEKLIEKQLAAAGLPEAKITWSTFAGPSVSVDALLSSNVDVIGVGPTSLLALWARTTGSSLEVKGIAALSDLPIYLNSTNPALKSIEDYGDKDRISVSSIKISVPAVVLQMAAAKAFGPENFAKLDRLTVSLGVADAMANLLSFRGEIGSDLTSPPFSHVELEDTRVHKVLDSRDVLGAASIAVTVTTSRFHKENPKTYAAIVAAFREAADIIAKDKPRAIEAYFGATGDRKTSRETMLKILSEPQSNFDLTPRGMMKYAVFMKTVSKTLTKTPDDWKALFFPDVHALPGD